MRATIIPERDAYRLVMRSKPAGLGVRGMGGERNIARHQPAKPAIWQTFAQLCEIVLDLKLMLTGGGS